MSAALLALVLVQIQASVPPKPVWLDDAMERVSASGWLSGVTWKRAHANARNEYAYGMAVCATTDNLVYLIQKSKLGDAEDQARFLWISVIMQRAAMELRPTLEEMYPGRDIVEDANQARASIEQLLTKSFPDVPVDHWAAEAVATLKAEGMLRGYPSGTFSAPTRSAVLGLAVQVPDLPETHWIYEGFARLRRLGLMREFGRAGPGRILLRAELAEMLVEAIQSLHWQAIHAIEDGSKLEEREAANFLKEIVPRFRRDFQAVNADYDLLHRQLMEAIPALSN